LQGQIGDLHLPVEDFDDGAVSTRGAGGRKQLLVDADPGIQSIWDLRCYGGPEGFKAAIPCRLAAVRAASKATFRGRYPGVLALAIFSATTSWRSIKLSKALIITVEEKGVILASLDDELCV